MMNVDYLFRTQHKHNENMLANTSNLLFKNRDALFFKRKYEIHSLNEEQIKE